MPSSRPRPAAPFRLGLCAAALGALGSPVFAQEFAASTFNKDFLGVGGDQQNADLSLFAFGNRVLPGRYTIDVSVNDRRVGQAVIDFDAKKGKTDAEPCLTRSMLDDWGVNVAVFSSLTSLAGDACVDLGTAIPDASFSYDSGKLHLAVSIPQAAMKRSVRGAVDPSKWDRGITAGMVDYQVNFARHGGDDYRRGPDPFAIPNGVFDGNPFRERRKEPRRDILFLGLRGGFNYGDWRLRHFSTYSRGTDGRARWQAVNTYAQRDLHSLHAQLLIGDGSTPGNLFDSVPFRGVQLASDESMLPDSQQGYAPTIRGIAQTNARVTVRQNGYAIYSTFVAPGAFVIDDLYPTASSGDLEVVVTEADGREIKFIQAFSAVPTLLREGTWRFSATVGKYRRAPGDEFIPSYHGDGGLSSWPWIRSQRSRAEPAFVQGTVARGLSDGYSVYGGLIAAGRYQSVMAGVGKNMRAFGAVSADLAAARAVVPQPLLTDRTYNGQSVRFLYAKAFDAGTTVRVAGYRYSTSGYRTFQEAADMQGLDPRERLHNRRNELRLELSQSLGEWGAVFASARQQSYWGTSAKDSLVQIGYSGNYKQFGYSVYYNRSSSYLGRAPSNQIMFSLSIPLGSFGTSAQYAVTHDRDGRTNQQVSLFGTALEDSRLSYSVSANHVEQQGSTGSASVSYLAPVGRFDLSHSQGSNYRQTSFSMAGGLLAHGGGVTLSQPLGDTIALVQLPKASGVGIESQPGVATDWAGNAVVSNVSPYRANRLAVRTQDLGDTMDVKNAATEVVPTRGAVVRAVFETAVGYRVMLTLTRANGEPLPFGSRVESETGQEMGIVGPDGQAFVSGVEQSGRLIVRWGQREEDRCTVSYSLPDEPSPSPIREAKSSCAVLVPDEPKQKGTP
ncbi:fimbria/pilus outer membrane usher protein [Variovorax sp. DAIF25]|uniref:fimbria/pilus outer membrane usher protein n=1 Tax=Variovorax sp. DAIF25 TaxID=3080983 RepID=UPI003D6C330E